MVYAVCSYTQQGLSMVFRQVTKSLYGKVDGASNFKEQANVDVQKTCFLFFGQKEWPKLVAERLKMASCQYHKDP